GDLLETEGVAATCRHLDLKIPRLMMDVLERPQTRVPGIGDFLRDDSESFGDLPRKLQRPSSLTGARS
ncbi:MAG: hypothetical protein JWO39_2153, partial [Gemmatimonadetes bacterium]|nr:hypothetical protein [Gemmatimonadota bacterium]